jgi:hypothetical protein
VYYWNIFENILHFSKVYLVSKTRFYQRLIWCDACTTFQENCYVHFFDKPWKNLTRRVSNTLLTYLSLPQWILLYLACSAQQTWPDLISSSEILITLFSHGIVIDFIDRWFKWSLFFHYLSLDLDLFRLIYDVIATVYQCVGCIGANIFMLL